METTEKLDPDFKKKWVAALRSGEYKQGIDFLYNEVNNSYCCLGVAGHLCSIPNELLQKDGFIGLTYEVKPNAEFPKALIKERGILSVATKLADMNDQGQSFDQIADWIEENL